MKELSRNKVFNGQQIQIEHASDSLDCTMQFSIFLPPQAETQKVPVLYWLSGLTCTDQNFVTKAGAQKAAAEHGVAIVCPDTSPRGENVPDDPEKSWDFGLGAGFYVNAIQQPWAQHYQMASYVVDELPALVNANFNVDAERNSLSGHSMGGHGALTLALNNPKKYKSVSAFSPIVSPLNCPWGVKALSLYIGDDREQWRQYDACELVRSSKVHTPMMVDQGDADSFLQEQLKTHRLVDAINDVNYPANIRIQPGYDHSYFFIASFIDQHIAFHAKHLTA